jgi:hypothetical protein
VVTVTPSPSPSPTPLRTGGADFFFQPGSANWCGLFESYRPSTSTALGELKIGQVTFIPSAGNPGQPAFDQRVASDVRSGAWVCLAATVANSETVANVLTNFALNTAPIGSMPSAAIRATPCGAVTDLFVSDIPSGGFIMLAGTKFLVGGARQSSDVVQLPPAGDLRVGVQVCIVRTTLTALDAGTFKAVGGIVTVR